MQRKNGVLKNSSRSAFALIAVIIMMIVIGSILGLSLSLTTQTSKNTTDIYLREQAELIAKSAVERAMLEVANNGCQNSFNTSHELFDINITMQYIGTSDFGSGCSMYINNLTTPEQNGSILMDVVVSSKENVTTEPIRFFRRSIQKM